MEKEVITRKWQFGGAIVEEWYSKTIGYTYRHYSLKYDRWFTTCDRILSEAEINRIAEERESDLLEKYDNDINL
jgi:hypothetical protein